MRFDFIQMVHEVTQLCNMPHQELKLEPDLLLSVSISEERNEFPKRLQAHRRNTYTNACLAHCAKNQMFQYFAVSGLIVS